MEPINMNSITFHQLQICVTVMEHGSFTDAANALFISQPSISKHVANLEQNLGVKLFTRGKNTAVIPTAAGAALIPRWQKMLSIFFHSATEAAEMQRRKNRVISIYFTPSMKKDLFLSPILNEFLKQYPETVPHINLGSPQNGLSELIAGTTDFVIHSPYQREFAGHERIQADWLIRLPWSVGMLNSNPLAAKEKLSWSDLKDMHFVLPNSPSFIQTVDNYCTQAGFHPQIAFLCRFFSAVSSNICKSDEIFLTDRYMIDYGLEGYSYVDIEDSAGCGLLMHTRKDEKDEQVLYLKQLLIDWFKTHH